MRPSTVITTHRLILAIQLYPSYVYLVEDGRFAAAIFGDETINRSTS
jgi:hypothetical protein